MSPSDDSTFPTTNSKRATYALAGIKVLELILLIVCIGLIDDPATHSHIRIFVTPRVAALCYVTFGCLLIYTAIYLIMAVVGDITSWRAAALWSLVALVLFVTTTILLFRDWSTSKDLNYWHPNMQRLDLVLYTACASLVTSLVYVADLLATIRFGMHGELD